LELRVPEKVKPVSAFFWVEPTEFWVEPTEEAPLRLDDDKEG